MTKQNHNTISRRPIDVFRTAIEPRSRALTRAARRAQRVQDRPRRRRRSGRSCATERSEGAPVLAQRPAALPRSVLQALSVCEAQRAEHRLWMEAPTSSPLRSRSRLRRRLQSVSCCAVALCDPQSSNGSEFKSSHSLTNNQSACTLVGLVLSPASGGSRENRIWMQRLVSSPPARARALRRRLPSARHCL